MRAWDRKLETETERWSCWQVEEAGESFAPLGMLWKCGTENQREPEERCCLMREVTRIRLFFKHS